MNGELCARLSRVNTAEGRGRVAGSGLGVIGASRMADEVECSLEEI
jgi:hypothetical protein